MDPEFRTPQVLHHIRQLAPEWFYPVMFAAVYGWKKDTMPEISHAEALAKPGLERDLIAQYREDFAGYVQYKIDRDLPSISDDRPMTRGKEIRARM